MKPIKILIMSVGPFSKNGTAKWLLKLGAERLGVACLPKEFGKYADSYKKKNIEVFIYDEKKYVNKNFEFFGFKPRNCGGIGRQGIAEAVEKYGDEFICFELDDDTAGYCIRSSIYGKSATIKTKEELERIIRTLNSFYQQTGIVLAGKTGATPPSGSFTANRKIFNNFLMRKDDPVKSSGFAALCSDDYRYNVYENLLCKTPTVSTELLSITFTQSQGDRNDGNAVLYNGDLSWKKSWSLKMMFPWCVEQKIKKESNRVLFRENIKSSKIYPPICLVDKNQRIVGKML